MSLKVKIVGLFLLLALVPYVVIALFLYIDVRQSAEKDAMQETAVLATIQKNRMQELLSKYTLQLDQFTTRLQLRQSLKAYVASGDLASLATIARIIDEAKKGTPNIKDIYILSTNGEVLASTEEGARGMDVSKESYFQKGLVTNTVSTLVKMQNIVYLYQAGPLILNDEQIGVIAIRVSTDDLFRMYSDYSGLGDSGYWILAERLPNGDARIIVPRRFATSTTSSLETVIKRSTQLPIAQAVGGTEMTFPDVVVAQGKHAIVSTRYVPELGWGIAVVAVRSEVLAPSHALALQLLLFSSLLVVFIAFLSVVVSQEILRPIQQLSGAARRAASGDLSKFLMVRSHDELGILASTFNTMLAKLKSSHDDLEKRVQERTKEAHDKLLEVERLNKVMVGRELQMVELKKKLAEMENPENKHD
ncbi:HAMP domain-containing protein [Candidatus Kaiserbacteria bacterium]|nr:HAMP domain-containing protein [Candidatus Kaiserbacteria bacterium]